MNHKKVYLAGPISGLTYDEAALTWRQYVDKNLAGDYTLQYNEIIKCYSPMRGKQFLKASGELGSQGYNQNPLSTAPAILGRDRNDVATSQLVFVNLLGAKITSIGTMVEFGWADAYRVPIVLVMEPEGNIHSHLFPETLATYRVSNLDAGIACAKSLLLPGE